MLTKNLEVIRVFACEPRINSGAAMVILLCRICMQSVQRAIIRLLTLDHERKITLKHDTSRKGQKQVDDSIVLCVENVKYYLLKAKIILLELYTQSPLRHAWLAQCHIFN